MGGAVDLPQALLADLGVHLRRRDRGVAEQLLHDPQVGAVVEQVGGAASGAARAASSSRRAGRPAGRSFLTTAHAAWRVSRPPRRLRNTASASSRRRHCAGHQQHPAARARTTRRAPRRRARPNGTMRSFDPLPNSRTRRPSKSMSPIDSPHASEMRAPVRVQQLEQGPVAPRDRVVADDGVEQRRRPRPRSAAWGSRPAPARPRGRPSGRRPARPRSRGSGAACASPRAGGRRSRPPPTARPPLGDEVDERRRCRPHRGRARARASHAGVRHEVAAVGGDRVRRPAPLGHQPRQELLDLERQRSRRPSSPATTAFTARGAVAVRAAGARSSSSADDRLGVAGSARRSTIASASASGSVRAPRSAPPRGRAASRHARPCSRWPGTIVVHRVGHPGRRVELDQRRRRPGGQPGLLDQLAPCRLLGGSPSTSRIPAGISTITRSYGGRYCATSTTDGLPSASKTSGTTPTAPGERTMSRSNGSPSGPRSRPTTTSPDVALVDLAGRSRWRKPAARPAVGAPAPDAALRRARRGA